MYRKFQYLIACLEREGSSSAPAKPIWQPNLFQALYQTTRTQKSVPEHKKHFHATVQTQKTHDTRGKKTKPLAQASDLLETWFSL